MRIHLYYVDKNRQKRGYARNYNLYVDFEHKTFWTRISPFYWYEKREDVETARKSDIIDYENLLIKNWFIRTDF